MARSLVPVTALTAIASLAGAAETRYELLDAAAAHSVLNASESSLKLGVQLQFRYDLNLRDDDSTTLAGEDDDTTLGFSMRRARIEAAGRINDSMKGKLVFGFNRATGQAAIEDAVLDWAVSDDLILTAGQFKLPFGREELVSSKRQLFPERSPVNKTVGQSRGQGVQIAYQADAWRAAAAFSDGFATENTAFDSDDEADYALTARAEFKFGDADWKAFDQFTSFRAGPEGVLVGAAAHWQSAGDTNPSLPDDSELFGLTADVSVLGGGWNAFASGVWLSTDDGTDDFDDFGLVVQGGVFFTDRLEGIARWSSVFADGDRANGDDYSDLALGVNYYIVPESHAAKFTAAVVYSFDATTDSVVSTSTGHNLLPDSEDGQIALTFQLQLLF